MSYKSIFLILWAGFLLIGCEESSSEEFQYFDIKSQLTNLYLDGYDGYFHTDWDIINTTDQILGGWEIQVRVVTSSYQIETGIFFQHDTHILPGDTTRFNNNIMFHRDSENIFPISLSVPDTTIRSWKVFYTRGIVFN